jgi:hypothetical protein
MLGLYRTTGAGIHFAVIPEAVFPQFRACRAVAQRRRQDLAGETGYPKSMPAPARHTKNFMIPWESHA